METPRDEFQHQLSVLRGGILEYARSPSAVFPILQFFGDFKRDDARLTVEISAARDRISKAPAAHDAYSAARQRFDATKAEHETAQKALKGLYKPLGAAAFAAFRAGEIPRQQQFAERINLDERIARLKSDQNALDVSPDSGIVVKGKAKAQQLAVAARIMFAKLSARKMESQIGKALIDAQSEDSVRSASTTEVLDDVASARRDVASCKRDFDLAANALESAKAALIQILAVSNIDTDAAIAERLDALRWELTATQLRLQHTEDKFLDSLVSNAGSFAETPIGATLNRLAGLLSVSCDSPNKPSESGDAIRSSEPSQPPRPRSLAEAIAIDKKASPATKKRSRGRIALIACGVVIGLLLILRVTAPIFFPSEYAVMSESPKIIVPEIGGVKIGDSLADAKQHMKFLIDGDENKTTGSGYKTIPIDGGQIWIEYWFLDSKVVDIELSFPGESFDILVDLLSEKFGERPYMVRRQKNGWITKYWKTAGDDGAFNAYVLTRPPFVIGEPNMARGFSLGNQASSWTVRGRESMERDEQTKAALKKQL